ncbi:MAG TPA: hypothetical protein VL263_01405 [Vicinamibacterales bacterium]|nr:hypothetical protein [Vicinamibacterales bacterium]
MLISVVNHTNGKLTDEQIQAGIRAVNRQIAHDFSPHWHIGADLRLEGSIGKRPDRTRLPELRGDAIVYLWDSVRSVDDAVGFHESNAAGIPFGVVFTELVKEMDEPWTATLSHEALELIGDPEVNLLVAGPHPADPDKEVFHWYEMCDAVQDEIYKIDGQWVSNFVLPLYFTVGAEAGGRNDFLGRRYKGRALRSFGINPGGYIGFYNPKTGDDETVSLDGDRRAAKRLKVKSKAQITRRSMRYKLGIKYQDRVAEVASAALARGAVEGAAAVRVVEPAEKLEPLAVRTLDVSTARRARNG